MNITKNRQISPKIIKVLISMAAGAVAGFAGAYFFLHMVQSGVLGPLDASREIAGLIGVIYALIGVAVGVGVISPSVGARFLNVEDAGELEEQRRMLMWSSVGVMALGVWLILLALASPAGPVDKLFVLVATVALVLLTWLTSARQMRLADELAKAVSRECTTLAFYLLFLVGGGWAVLAHLDYATGPGMLDWISMFSGVTLLAAFIVCGRRGMLTPR